MKTAYVWGSGFRVYLTLNPKIERHLGFLFQRLFLGGFRLPDEGVADEGA